MGCPRALPLAVSKCTCHRDDAPKEIFNRPFHIGVTVLQKPSSFVMVIKVIVL